MADISYERLASIFKALSDETRLHIIDMLSCNKLCAADILASFNLSQSTLSYHMKILIESKVVESRKDKKWTYYSLSDSGSELAKNTLSEILTKSENYSSFCICED